MYCGFEVVDLINEDAINEKEIKKFGQFSWNAYPNPTNGPLSIKFNEAIEIVYVMDLSGRILQSHRTTDMTITQINLSQYPEGIYILKGEGKSGEVSSKIVLSRFAVNVH